MEAKEEKLNSLKANTIFSFITQLINYITPFVIAPYISRVLMPDGIGEYSFGFSLLSYFEIFALFGFSSYAIKQISLKRNDKEEYSKIFWSVFVLKVIFSLLAIGFYIASIYIFNIYDKVNIYILYALIIVIIGDMFDIGFVLQGLEKFKIVSIVNTVCNIVYMIGIFLFVSDTSDLLTYTLLKSGLKLLISFCFIMFSYKYISKFSFDVKVIKYTLIGAFLFFLPNLTMTISPIIDQTMLGLMCTNDEVGYYQQTHKIVNLVSALVYALGPVMMSRMSYVFGKMNSKDVSLTVIKGLTYASIIVLPCSFGLLAISKYFIPAYFGDEFIKAIPVMYFFIPYTLLTPIASLIINSYYYPSGKVKSCTIILAISILVNFLLNIYFINEFQAVGAAIASSISNVILLFLLMFFSRKAVSYIEYLKNIIKIFVSAFLMFIMIFILNKFLENYLNNMFISIIGIFVGAILYFAFLLILKDKVTYSLLFGIKKRFFGGRKNV